MYKIIEINKFNSLILTFLFILTYFCMRFMIIILSFFSNFFFFCCCWWSFLLLLLLLLMIFFFCYYWRWWSFYPSFIVKLADLFMNIIYDWINLFEMLYAYFSLSFANWVLCCRFYESNLKWATVVE